MKRRRLRAFSFSRGFCFFHTCILTENEYRGVVKKMYIYYVRIVGCKMIMSSTGTAYIDLFPFFFFYMFKGWKSHGSHHRLPVEESLTRCLLRWLCKWIAQLHSTSIRQWLFLRGTCRRARHACHSTYSTKTHSDITWNSRRDLRSLLVGFLFPSYLWTNNEKWIKNGITINVNLHSMWIDFALSALKNSFSMSSLSQTCHPGGAGTPSSDTPPSAVPQTPDVTARLKWERPFNSLTRLK